MPKIFLKPNSAQFAESRAKQNPQPCEMPGCPQRGEHKAPKDRALSEHYWFCLDHIRDYNKAWNFFEGMSAADVDEHMRKSMYGDRPTWKHGVNGTAEDTLYRKAWQTYNHNDEPPPRDEKKPHSYPPGENRNTPEFEAMALMGLEAPVTLKTVKKRYKELAKKHHPDLNRGCPKSENLLKEINMAYTILKLAYEKFETLPERN